MINAKRQVTLYLLLIIHITSELPYIRHGLYINFLLVLSKEKGVLGIFPP